jgi:hypothetical protein
MMTHRFCLKALRAAVLIAVLAALFGPGPVRALADNEDSIKSAFLFNFAKFTEWPADAPAGRIVVGFVAADALAETFEKNIVGKNANGREFAIKKLAAGEAASCHIVYVGDAGQISASAGAAKGKPVLVIGEAEGGAIAFMKDGPKLTFALDLDAAKASNLKLDPKLQKVAKTVKGA